MKICYWYRCWSTVAMGPCSRYKCFFFFFFAPGPYCCRLTRGSNHSEQTSPVLTTVDVPKLRSVSQDERVFSRTLLRTSQRKDFISAVVVVHKVHRDLPLGRLV